MLIVALRVFASRDPVSRYSERPSAIRRATRIQIGFIAQQLHVLAVSEKTTLEQNRGACSKEKERKRGPFLTPRSGRPR